MFTASAAVRKMVRAVATLTATFTRRSCSDFCASLRCRRQPLSTRERCVLPARSSLLPMWCLLSAAAMPGTASCSVLSRGSAMQTVSLKLANRRRTRSMKLTMSPMVSLSLAGMAEASNSASMWLRILLGIMALMSSALEGQPPSRAPAPSWRKGLQLTRGARAQALRSAPARRHICFAAPSVLSTRTTGLAVLIAWKMSLFRSRAPLPPMNTWPSGARTSGTRGIAFWSRRSLVLNSQSTSAAASSPVKTSSR
mmetsp:Transcript_21165/g.66968  ORF Transcript_21165/g.66968 Transcript_21165/m.66968 type:complete len:254 (-) Transcript_21165:88-849(-)